MRNYRVLVGLMLCVALLSLSAAVQAGRRDDGSRSDTDVKGRLELEMTELGRDIDTHVQETDSFVKLLKEVRSHANLLEEHPAYPTYKDKLDNYNNNANNKSIIKDEIAAERLLDEFIYSLTIDERNIISKLQELSKENISVSKFEDEIIEQREQLYDRYDALSSRLIRYGEKHRNDCPKSFLSSVKQFTDKFFRMESHVDKVMTPLER
jgi:hypothetical protein